MTPVDPILKPLVLDRHSMAEIADAVGRLFAPHTKNVSLHCDPSGIQIMVFAPPGQPFQMPGGPVDIRLRNKEIHFLPTLGDV